MHCPIDVYAAFEPGRLPLHLTVFILKDETPGKFIRSRGTGVPTAATNERAYNLVTCGSAFAAQFAVDLLTALVSPNGATNHARGRIVQHDGCGTESPRGTPRPSEQQ